eukprot:CAMPEP_0172458332 /NCGR_PEP_ID=MMETSP1065-20121228/27084_1 /TAXON_ID=265537 /ORGANISM="Amphiprora paludosa, Strain CCMP125" /LENGTH=57 /DNA_ID=CAMNT_0013212531 /DNA_START=131 /DNA_END=301 /DNA_ORIENTATION=+
MSDSIHAKSPSENDGSVSDDWQEMFKDCGYPEDELRASMEAERDVVLSRGVVDRRQK